MKNLKYILISLILVLNFSCSDSKVITDSLGTFTDSLGTLTLKLTDAPMPYNQFMAVNITIDKIELGNAADANSFIVIMNQSTTYNMLTLVNGITETMANMEIPEGQYDTLRLYISSTEMVMNNGDSFTYNMSQNGLSGSGNMMGGSMVFNNQTGSIDITLDHFINIMAGSQNDFLMDLDIDHSFMLDGLTFSGMGGAGMMSMTGFTFNPTMRFVNLGDTGTISGFVHMGSDGLSDVNISLMQNGMAYTSTHTDGTGHYKIIGVPTGTYTIMAEADGYMMNSSGNEANMGTMQMANQTDMTVDFDMIVN